MSLVRIFPILEISRYERMRSQLTMNENFRTKYNKILVLFHLIELHLKFGQR